MKTCFLETSTLLPGSAEPEACVRGLWLPLLLCLPWTVYLCEGVLEEAEHVTYVCVSSVPLEGGGGGLVWTDTLVTGSMVSGPPATLSHRAPCRILTTSSSPVCLFNGTINMEQLSCQETTFSFHITGSSDVRRPRDTWLLPSPHVCGRGWGTANSSRALAWDSCT